MARYEKEHRVIDVSPIPLIPALAKKTTIRDTKTGREASGHDWNSFRESDRKAWQKLKEKK